MSDINKRKITIEVEDLSTFITGLNNAIIAYNDVVCAIDLCCNVPSALLPLKNIPFEKLRERQKSLKDVYEQLIEIEKRNL